MKKKQEIAMLQIYKTKDGKKTLNSYTDVVEEGITLRVSHDLWVDENNNPLYHPANRKTRRFLAKRNRSN